MGSTSGAPRSVAVVIPSWNSLEHLRPCLGSLDGQGVEVELLVIDNGSGDGSLEFLRRERIPHVALARNTGFSVAVNLGAARTHAPAVMVLNADTRLEPGCLGQLLDALEQDERLGGAQPLIMQAEDGASAAESDHVYSLGQALTRDGRGFEQGAGAPLPAGLPARREVFGVCGAACLLRRELFTQLGGYDESYFAFCEDVDLNVRARIAGWSFATVTGAVIRHVGNASWQEGFANPAAENARLVARNRLTTQVRFMPAGSIPLIAVVELGALARAILERRFLATLRGKLQALRRLPRTLGERRRLRAAGDPSRARAWLGRP